MSDGREHEIAEAVEHLVEPDEEWIIRSGERGVVAHLGNRSSLSGTHPALYGRLLQFNEALSSAGSSFVVVGLIGVLGACVGIHMQWFDEFLGADAPKFRSGWVYGFLIITTFFVLGWLANFWEGTVYGQVRTDVLAAFGEAGLTPHEGLAEIDDDESLDNLATWMKRDRMLI